MSFSNECRFYYHILSEIESSLTPCAIPSKKPNRAFRHYTDEGDVTKESDAELVRRTLDGDSVAFTTLVRKYQSVAYGLCYHRTRSFQIAEELSQEVFTLAYRDLVRLRDVRRFGQWLHGIAINVCRNYARQQMRHMELPLDFEPTDELGKNPEMEIVEAEVSACVMEILDELPQSDRLLLTMYYMDEFRYSEIANFLDVPLSTVKSRLHKARQKSKEEFTRMVAKEFEKHSLPDGFAEKVVREAIETGKSARERHDTREASKQAEIALETLKNIGAGEQKTKAHIDALQLKGDSIRFSSGLREAITYYEQVLSLKRTAGTKREYAEYLESVAAEYSNLGEETKALEARTEALGVFEDIEDKSGQATVLTWLGSHHFMKEQDEESLVYFGKALKLYSELGFESAPMHAVCWSAAQLLRKIKSANVSGKMIGRNAVCEYLRAESNRLVYLGEPGFGKSECRNEAERALFQSPYPWIAQAKTIIDTSKNVGDSWKSDAHSFTSDPLKAVATIRSDSEIVTTPAGTFNDCLMIEVVVREKKRTSPPENQHKNTKLNKRWCGTKKFWYAPNVGLVKCHLSPVLGDETTLVLIQSNIPNDDLSRGNEFRYFPTQRGSSWDYTCTNADSRYLILNHAEILSTDGNKIYLAHYIYVIDTSGKE